METEEYIISSWYEEAGETHFIFNRAINYINLFPISEEDLLNYKFSDVNL